MTRRWLTTVIVAVVVAGAALLPASPATAANAIFWVATLNILYKLNDADFRQDLELITGRADLVGLNEVAGRKAFLQTWAAQNGWWFYAPEPDQAASEALLARKSLFDVVSKGSVFSCDTNGPGEVPPARYNNWVKYVHKPTGRNVFHINFHANASIESGGRPEDLPRTACAERQFRDVKQLATSKQAEGQVLVSGDLNVDFSADRAYGYANFPWKVFEANELPNLRSVYNLYGEQGTGTHGSRHIDSIYSWKRIEQYQLMWLTDYQLVSATKPDHNGLVATLSIAR